MAKRKKPVKNEQKKKLHKVAKTRRVSGPKKVGSGRPKTKSKSKPVSKGRPVHSRRTPKQLRNNPRLKSATKSRRVNPSVTKRTKGNKPAKVGSNKSVNKAIKKRSSRVKYTTAKHIVKDKDGKQKRDNLGTGFKQAYEIHLPKGLSTSQAIEFIRGADLSFLEHAINKNKPVGYSGKRTVKIPRAVTIKYRRTYRGQEHWSGRISDIDFVVRIENIRRKIMQDLQEYDDNWTERVEDVDPQAIDEETGKVNLKELTESGRALNPKNLDLISLTFTY